MKGTPLERMLAFGGRIARDYSAAEYPLPFIRDFITVAAKLEEGRRAHVNANEDALSNILAGWLLTAYPTLMREPDVGGHVDFALKHPLAMCVVLSGEAKLVDDRGFAWYAEGLTKLVAKYNTGRNDVALMVGYCRKPDMHAVMTAFEKQIAEEKTASFVERHDRSGLDVLTGCHCWFATRHSSSGRPITVVHAWVDLYYVTDKELKTAENKRRTAAKKGAKKEAARKPDHSPQEPLLDRADADPEGAGRSSRRCIAHRASTEANCPCEDVGAVLLDRGFDEAPGELPDWRRGSS